MPSQFALRDAVPEDASALAALSIEVWLNTYADEGVSKAYGDHLLEAFSVQAFTEQQDDRRIRTVVCHRHEYMLGYVKVLLDAQPPTPNSGTAEIVTLYVRERHKGRGIGSALLRRALAIGREAGHRSMFLIVNCNNARAIQFYRSHGMRFNGEWMYRFQNIEALNHVYVAESAERVSRSDEAS